MKKRALLAILAMEARARFGAINSQAEHMRFDHAARRASGEELPPDDVERLACVEAVREARLADWHRLRDRYDETYSDGLDG